MKNLQLRRKDSKLKLFLEVENYKESMIHTTGQTKPGEENNVYNG
jgi:hypothetical protein